MRSDTKMKETKHKTIGMYKWALHANQMAADTFL